MLRPLWERIQQFLTELSIHLVNNSEILLLNVYASEMKTHVRRDLNENGFMTVNSCPFMWGQISEHYDTPTMGYSSVIKRKEQGIHETTWVNCKCICAL